MGKRGFSLVIATSVSVGAVAGAVQAQCAADTASVRGDFGTAQFTVQVMDDDTERARGLMFVEQMATMEGMLFVYDRPQPVSFWMRNTLIPLDMVFVDGAGVIQKIHPMAEPLDETPIFGGDAIQYVLEINGGMAGRLGLDEGDQMQHPSFTMPSAWPCEIN